jgi:hypothetical protein
MDPQLPLYICCELHYRGFTAAAAPRPTRGVFLHDLSQLLAALDQLAVGLIGLFQHLPPSLSRSLNLDPVAPSILIHQRRFIATPCASFN